MQAGVVHRAGVRFICESSLHIPHLDRNIKIYSIIVSLNPLVGNLWTVLVYVCVCTCVWN